MKKILILFFLSVLSILIVTGCGKKETTDIEPEKNKPEYPDVAIIKKHPTAPLDVITCYQDSENNEACFGSEIGLYVEYKNEQLTINDALKQKLITLDDVKKSYKKFIDELSSES